MRFSLNSYIVAFCRNAMLLLAAGLAVGTFAWPYLFGQGLRNDLIAVHKSDSLDQDSITLHQATLIGRDETQRPVEIQAVKAIPMNEELSQIDLGKPNATLDLNDGGHLQVESLEGSFDRDSNRLDLSGDVRFRNAEGYELKSQSGSVGLADKSFETNSFVEGSGPRGTLSGEGMLIENGGQRIILKGKSTLTFSTQKEVRED